MDTMSVDNRKLIFNHRIILSAWQPIFHLGGNKWRVHTILRLPSETVKSVAIILKGYPRLSETFIAEEIHALERAGIELTLFSLRIPTDTKTHPVHDAICARVIYLPEYLYRQPIRVLCAWWKIHRHPQYLQARTIWWHDLKRDFSINRVRRFGQALVLAAEMPAQIELLYAHFLHTPSSVARYASVMRKVPWACSAHAKDIWTIPDWEKKEKLEHCKWLTTCTRTNMEHLRQFTSDPQKVALNYHGLALSRFPSEPPNHSKRNGSHSTEPVQLLSVGRTVAKKGYHELIDALAMLPQTLHWQMTHIGTGPLLLSLQEHAKAMGIAVRINWLGAQSQQAVINFYRRSDFFILNCCITADGDRDGLPNVLVEAQSQGLAVVSTRVSGVPELIEEDVNGLLVEANSPRALSEAVHRLMTNPTLRQRLGDAGRKIVFSKFDLQSNFEKLHRLVIGGFD